MLSSVMSEIGVSVIAGVFHIFGYTFDFLFGWLWMFLRPPHQKLAISQRIKAKPIVPGDHSSPYRSVDSFDKLLALQYPECTNVDALVQRAVRLHGRSPCLGSRQVLSKEEEMQPSGKVFIKEVLGDYVWQTFDEVNERVGNLAAGLRGLGLKPRSYLCLYAETRAEWLLTALACFRADISVVTLYSTLGDSAVITGINQTESSFVVTSDKLLDKFKSLLPQLRHVKHLIYMDAGKKAVIDGFLEGVEIHPMSTVEATGAHLEKITHSNASQDDVAVIMYTSGSTAAPKGVLISHLNILACIAGQYARVPDHVRPSDVQMAYLPLAHIYELFCELLVLTSGACIGYGSPNTLTDKSTGIKRGCKGDLNALRPTVMAIVPVILDRIRKAILDEVNSGSVLRRAVFQFAYEYKLRHYKAGYDTPVIDRLIFSKTHAILGGRMRYLMSGGAPLSPDTQMFLTICFCLKVCQGYGMTETCGAGSAQEDADRSTGHAGAPIPCNEFMLVDWPEGNYTACDQPRPRGELWVGGPNVALGYYKDPVKTAEVFHVINGQRWMATGDIAEFDAEGCMRIIDRKKDLIKLQSGEYIAPAKVETVIKLCPLIDNIFVFARSSEMYAICFVVPNQQQLMSLAAQNGIETTDSLSEMCKNDLLVEMAQKVIVDHCMKEKLEKMEIPRKIHLCADVWTPDTNLVTESYKLKRLNLEAHYRDEIRRLYQD